MSNLSLLDVQELSIAELGSKNGGYFPPFVILPPLALLGLILTYPTIVMAIDYKLYLASKKWSTKLREFNDF